jgi:D-alanine transaminase
MADVLWFNGRFTTTDEAVLTVRDRGLLFGDAIYEVLKFVDRAPILAAAHWRRLCRCLDMLEIRNPWTPRDWAALLDALLERTAFSEGIIYLQVSRGAGPRTHGWSGELDPSAFVWSSPFPFPDEATRESGVAVMTMPESRWARCEIKSVNLLPNAIAKTAARRAGVYEAVFVENGRIIEGSSSNFFAVVGGELVTPAAGSHLLPGTVRAAIIDLARDEGIVVREQDLAVSDLEHASEAFLTSTTSSVLPVTTIDALPVGDGRRGRVTVTLQSAFAAFEREQALEWKRRGASDLADQWSREPQA